MRGVVGLCELARRVGEITANQTLLKYELKPEIVAKNQDLGEAPFHR
jgi:hypothetical protein